MYVSWPQGGVLQLPFEIATTCEFNQSFRACQNELSIMTSILILNNAIQFNTIIPKTSQATRQKKQKTKNNGFNFLKKTEIPVYISYTKYIFFVSELDQSVKTLGCTAVII